MMEFTYEGVVRQTVDGKMTKYVNDAAGRLVKEGDKVYSYGGPDKIVNVHGNNSRN